MKPQEIGFKSSLHPQDGEDLDPSLAHAGINLEMFIGLLRESRETLLISLIVMGISKRFTKAPNSTKNQRGSTTSLTL
jgi:hypothetical protein